MIIVWSMELVLLREKITWKKVKFAGWRRRHAVLEFLPVKKDLK